MLSEGRGTTRPFELIGAPWIDGERLRRGDERAATFRACISGRRSSSRRSRSTRGRPAAAARSTCSTARRSARSATAVELIDEFRRQDPAQFAWREPPYEYEHEKPPIDILYGSRAARQRSTPGTWRALIASAAHDEDAFRQRASRYLLYCRSRPGLRCLLRRVAGCADLARVLWACAA